VGGLEGHGPPSVSLFEQERGVVVGLEGGNPLRLAFLVLKSPVRSGFSPFLALTETETS